jgi:hypothetical protein
MRQLDIACLSVPPYACVSCVLHDGFPVYSVCVFPAKTTFYNFAPTHMHACETLKMNLSCKMLVLWVCHLPRESVLLVLLWFCVYWESLDLPKCYYVSSVGGCLEFFTSANGIFRDPIPWELLLLMSRES